MALTPADPLPALREQVAAAAEQVQRCIPPEVVALVRDLGDQLDAASSIGVRTTAARRQ